MQAIGEEMLRFFVLGPLEIWSAHEAYPVKGNSQAIILFALLLNQDRVTSADQLMEEVWGHGHPHKPENALQAHISRLRRTLRAMEPQRQESRLVSQGSGYRLLGSDADGFDARQFAAAIGGLPDPAAMPPAQRAARLRAALDMWRGPVLGGITGGPICQAGAAEFETARLTACVTLFDAELELGNHAAVISQISELAAIDSAFQARYCEQLVIALCRSGRHADALEVCRGTWYRLVMSGAGCAESLRALERAILRHDPALTRRSGRLVVACPQTG